MGSEGPHGYELPENSANGFIFQCILNRITPLFGLNLLALQHTRLEFSDIANVRKQVILAHIERTLKNSIPCDYRSIRSVLDFRVFSPSGLEWSSISKSKYCDSVQPVLLLMESPFFATENGQIRKKVGFH